MFRTPSLLPLSFLIGIPLRLCEAATPPACNELLAALKGATFSSPLRMVAHFELENPLPTDPIGARRVIQARVNRELRARLITPERRYYTLKDFEFADGARATRQAGAHPEPLLVEMPRNGRVEGADPRFSFDEEALTQMRRHLFRRGFIQSRSFGISGFPMVGVDIIYPDDDPFAAVAKAIRNLPSDKGAPIIVHLQSVAVAQAPVTRTAGQPPSPEGGALPRINPITTFVVVVGQDAYQFSMLEDFRYPSEIIPVLN